MSDDDDIWADDLLGRKADAEFLQAFLVGRMEERKEREIRGSYVLNIDAQWGAGKTFFLDRLSRQLEAEGHVVARVNAWRDDHADEPFISVLAAIDEALHPFVKNDEGGVGGAWEAVKQGATPVLTRAVFGVGKTLVKRYVGMEAKELLALKENEAETSSIIADAGAAALEGASIEIERLIDESASKLIDAFTAKSKAIDDFRSRLGTAMETLAAQRKLPLFILVDELDRCRPSYAIALLERVKHLFDADNVVFVFATNSGQLKHSIRGAYGAEFDGYKYLKRFFDKTFALPRPSPSRFVLAEVQTINLQRIRTPSIHFASLLTGCAERYAMDLREISQICGIIDSVVTAWPHETHKIESLMLLPLAISFYREGTVDVEEVIRTIPEDCEIEIGRRQVDHWSSKPVTLQLRDAFTRLARLSLSINNAYKVHESASDQVGRYVSESFVHEWAGHSRSGDRPSVQFSLPMMVATAGAFQFNDDAKE